MTARITPSMFRSGGEDCAATLYLPPGIDKPPVVVMGHGLGALKEFRIPAFAERFVERGLAVFAFDYRHWGGSGGEPRQLLIPGRQLEDWHAAVAHVRTLAEVDGDRVGIWGSSFSGAHVIHVAAEDHAVKAVVAQVLAADMAGSLRGFGLLSLVRATSYGLFDGLRGLLGMKPLYIPLVGRPGEAGVLTTEECWEGYLPLVPEGAPWKNELAARSMLYLPLYRAIKVAPRVKAPTLLMAGIHDSLVPLADVRALAGRLPGAVLREYDCNHFQPYYPPLFDSFVSEQADFLAEKLAVDRSAH